MPDLPPAPPSEEPLVYRPISGLALAGFALACLFAVLIVVSTLASLFKGMPVFLQPAFYVIALLAVLLCLLAEWRIRNAEETFAGLALARWGLGLSLLLGATYFVFTWVTGLAVTKQSDDFLSIKADDNSGFFPRLLNAGKNRTDLYHAFLLSLPVTSRGGIKAENEDGMRKQYDQPTKDGEPGPLSKFAKHPLILILIQNPDKIQIEPLAVVDWNYEGNCYHVQRNYRFTTPEFVVEATVPTQSTEGTGEGDQRKWFVPMNSLLKLTSITPTPLGLKMSDLRINSKTFLEKWRAEFSNSTRAAVPMYQEAAADWEAVIPKREDYRTHVKKMVGEIFRGERDVPRYMFFLNIYNPTLDLFTPLQFADGRVRVHHPLRMFLPAAQGYPVFNLEFDLVVSLPASGELPVPGNQILPWEFNQIRLTRAVPVEKFAAPIPP